MNRLWIPNVWGLNPAGLQLYRGGSWHLIPPSQVVVLFQILDSSQSHKSLEVEAIHSEKQSHQSRTYWYFLPATMNLRKEALCVGVCLFPLGIVSATNPHGWSPSISLRDGSDEPDGNGWCPDIRGFGASLDCSGAMQCHSCKPAGSDTQFTYTDAATSSVVAYNYDADCTDLSGGVGGACITVVDEMTPGAVVTLRECDDDAAEQNFVYTTSGYLRIASVAGDELDLCLGVGEEIITAGNFWARDLLLLECATADASLITWDVQPTPTTVLDDSTTTDPVGSGPVAGELGTSPSAAPVAASSSVPPPDSTTTSSSVSTITFPYLSIMALLWVLMPTVIVV